MFFFFKQKTAYELRISDWSSDVCSSDLPDDAIGRRCGGGCPGFAHAVSFYCGTQEKRHLLCHAEPPGRRQDHGAATRPGARRGQSQQIARASCTESVCQFVSISSFAVSLNEKYH